ncbi:hypothetical protein ABZU76_33575 [Amycolatopsis sp. NPDC005232]|uniref:hypothetical protein n=1 Tax=Amycolatopsis sp. NPDC005232 TaxID=3157027 RepID=UPI0033B29181
MPFSAREHFLSQYPPGERPTAFEQYEGSGIALEWLFAAVGSGVAGNVAYDVLKGLAQRAATATWKPQRPLPEHDRLVLLAWLAVQVRCYRLELREPELGSLRLVSRLERDEAVELLLRGSALSVKVVSPSGSRRYTKPKVSVTLFTVESA